MREAVTTFFHRIDFIIRTENIRFCFISILLVMIISTVLFAFEKSSVLIDVEVGAIPNEDIFMKVGVSYIDQRRTNINRKIAAEQVPLVFDRNNKVLERKISNFVRLLAEVKQILKENPPIGTDDVSFQVKLLNQKLPKYLLYNDRILAELVRYQNTTELQRTVIRIFNYVYYNKGVGLLADKYDNPLEINNRLISVRQIGSNGEFDEITKKIDDLTTLDEINERLYGICYSLAPRRMSKKTISAITRIIRSKLEENITFNKSETELRIQDAVKKVKPVIVQLDSGEKIVEKGRRITPELYEKIQMINKKAKSAHFSYIVSLFVLQLVFLFIFGFFIMEYNRLLLPDSTSTWIIFTLITTFMLYTFFIDRLFVVDSKIRFVLLLPIPFVTMIISILYNIYLAIIVGVYLVFFTTIMGGVDLGVILLAFSSSVLGVVVNANVNKRTDFLRGGFVLGLVNVIIISCIILMKEGHFVNPLVNSDVALALVHGVINSILVFGMLPLFENVFGITTRFKLLELSDLNAEVFKKMLVKAPGTYNHSLVVATMSEAASKEIHANSLLARVGAYYHDIGKIEDYGIYIENKVTDSRAKSLDAVSYSQLIIAHVKKGVNIAKKYRLPESVIDFIREHHGRSTMTYFYHQALEQAQNSNGSTALDKGDFQYPGPKPHSKETAIVMLADAVEAASRTIVDPTSIKLEGLVRKIIYNKLNDGELEYSDLSMSELNRIQRTFLRILNGIFHTRIEYPDADKVKDLEKSVMRKNGKKNSD